MSFINPDADSLTLPPLSALAKRPDLIPRFEGEMPAPKTMLHLIGTGKMVDPADPAKDNLIPLTREEFDARLMYFVKNPHQLKNFIIVDSVSPKPSLADKARTAIAGLDALSVLGENIPKAHRKPGKPAIKSPRRNEPCDCGSKKKFKHCCGKVKP
jgi:hypothetical protein